MGIASMGGIFAGAGNVSAPNARETGRAFSGLLGQYMNQLPNIVGADTTYKPELNAANVGNIAANFPQLSNILSGGAGGVADLVRNLNPGQTNLLDSLTKSASTQLNSGAELDPQLQRLFEQSIRGGQAARGLGFGPSDAFNESLGLTQFGNDLRTQREQFAGNVAGMNDQFTTEHILPMLTNILQSAGAINQGSTPSILPTSLTQALLTMPYLAKANARTATAANTTGLYQSLDSNSTSFFNNLLSV
jgi:hypothetical protein